MIPEIISFAERIKNETATAPVKELNKKNGREPNKRPAIIVLETEGSDTDLKLKGEMKILDDDSKIEAFLETVRDLHALEFEKSAEGFRRWLRDQIHIRNINKCLGSTGGLLNSIPFAFQLTEKNISGFENKASKMKFNEWAEPNKTVKTNLTDGLRALYLSLHEDETRWKVLSENEKSLVFVLLPDSICDISRYLFYQAFGDDRRSEPENEKFLSEKEMSCPICKKSARLTNPRDQTYQSKKPFLFHVGRGGEDSQYSFRLCLTCENKYEDAKDAISTAKFRIFPLFSDKDTEKDFRYTDEYGVARNFKDIMSDPLIRSIRKERKEFNFHLIARSGSDIWLCDYICGYSPFITGPEGQDYNRFDLENAWKDLFNVKFINYFDDKPDFGSRSNHITSIYLALRQKIFSSVYRGENNLLKREDVERVCDLRIREILIKESKLNKNCQEAVQAAFELLNILRWEIMDVPTKEDQQNALKLGRAFRIVIGKSKAENPHNLLSLALDKPTMDGAKSILTRLLDKYHHAFNELEPHRALISECLKAQYHVNKFDLLKTQFYAGYFEVSQ